MILTVFRSRLREDLDAGYAPMAERTETEARAMPGFVSFKTFVSADGERVSIIEFDSREHHDAWRDHTLHREAQAEGRARWYAEYDIKVCEVVRSQYFAREQGTS